MTAVARRWLNVSLGCALWSLMSCSVDRKLEKNLERHRGDATAQSHELQAALRSNDSFALTWEDAVKLLEERNVQLQQSRLRIVELKRERDQQWRHWLPRFSFYLSLRNSLSELGKLSFSENLDGSIVAPLVIPDPVHERARAFQNALGYLEARDSLELSYRRQVTALYRIFSQYETLQRQAASRREEPTSVASAIGRIETELMQEEAVMRIQGSLAQMLDLPGKRPVPVASTRPRIDYRNRLDALQPGRNYGHLAMRLSAYQIEGALLREKGIKLRRWPFLNLSTSTPPLYSSGASADDDYLNPDRIFLFGGLSKSWDVTGSEAAAVRSAEQNTEFVKKNLRQRLDQEMREWLRLKKRYHAVTVAQVLAEQRLEVVRRRSSGGSVASELEAVRGAQERLASLEQAKEQLDLEIWIWDDAKWN